MPSNRTNLAEAVVFSSRIQLLVSRLGRSSKPQPRFLVLVRSLQFFHKGTTEPMFFSLWQTGKALFIVVSAEKDGRVTTTLERKIQLVTIRAFAMSNLRDDWVVSEDLNFP